MPKFFVSHVLCVVKHRLFVKFSLIICGKVENKAISFRTFVCLDVSVGEIL